MLRADETRMYRGLCRHADVFHKVLGRAVAHYQVLFSSSSFSFLQQTRIPHSSGSLFLFLFPSESGRKILSEEIIG